MPAPIYPQLLNKDFLRECKRIILSEGTLADIGRQLGVDYDTLYRWYSCDVQRFGTKIDRWKNDLMLRKAEKIIAEALDMDVQTPVLFFGKEIGKQINPRMVKIKMDNAQFVAETLGKKKFSKRTESTGEDGQPLVVQVVNYGDAKPAKEELDSFTDDEEI